MVEKCYACVGVKVTIPCLRCGIGFCHEHFEFHDCDRVSGEVAAVERILEEREREREI